KTDENREFYNPERERQIYERLRSINKGPFPEEALKSVFREIISASLSMEKPINIAFLGPHATFTHQAAIKHFGQSGNFIAREDIPGVFDEVERGRANYGVVPIESTAEGAVSHTLDMFVDSPLQICAEVLLEVSSSLLNKSGKVEDIERVCSHPHALAQCGRWLKETLPGVVAVEVSSTAQAAQMAADDEKTAAIAGEAAASLYGLRVAQKSIQDNPYNYTRFLVIGKREAKRTGNDKTSVIFAIKDSPGALYDILKPLSEKGINLSKIESRPLKTKAWEYVFYIDMDGYKDDEDIARSIEGLNKRSSFMKVLGSYEKNSVGK
ncbi:MAG: prephenate dehydratase, partial [Deltaproteobacteria bacterium]|nr:prephenate dehydratase [Deltaproteobacteria bacterium]